VTAVTTRLATLDDVAAIAALHAQGWEAFRSFLPEAVWARRTEERRLREWPAALEQREVILAEEDGAATILIRTFADGPVRGLFDRLGGEVGERRMRDYGGGDVAEVTYRWPTGALVQAIANA
jgi:hypothetical protein